MIDIKQLTNTTVDTFRTIPELVALIDSDAIVPYTYTGAKENKLENAITNSSPNSILVGWVETLKNETPDGWWLHRFWYILRGSKDLSPLDLLTALMNGVPNPGDGQRWRLCGFMDGLNPASIPTIAQQPDNEGIDFIQITAEILETRDV